MKDFLTSYAKYNSSLDKQDENTVKNAFIEAIDRVYRAIGPKAFRMTNALNAAVFESIMVGLSCRISGGAPIDSHGIAMAYHALMVDYDYLQAVSKATAREDQVKTRLEAAIRAFGAV